jgi:mono/diheme cytochrome c family protein
VTGKFIRAGRLAGQGDEAMQTTPSVLGALALLGASIAGACGSNRTPARGVAPAPIDTTLAGDSVVSRRDTIPSRTDSVVPPDSGSSRRDSVPVQPTNGESESAGSGPRVSRVEYEGWRQYSVNCARCHGQDVLPNPVAANLLISLAPGGPINNEQTFAQVVAEGRVHRGMPAFKGVLTPEQISATYAYVKGRAEKRIPPGRPERPS